MEINTVTGGFVAACWFVFYAVWIIAAFSTRRTTVRLGHRSGWRLAVLAIVVFLLARGRQGAPLARELWTYSPTLGVIADIVTVAGLAIAIWARAVLGAFWSANVVLKEQHAVVDRGPYGYVRHPIYSGVLLMVLGTVILWGRINALVLFVVVFAGLSVKARLEERLLSEHLAGAYREYKSRVRFALIPWVL
jgi:protein-S-isoprenylcysteine O-methyltransferase Ste14